MMESSPDGISFTLVRSDFLTLLMQWEWSDYNILMQMQKMLRQFIRIRINLVGSKARSSW